MHVAHVVFDLLALGLDVELLGDLGPIEGTLNDPVADNHSVGESVLVEPGDLDIDKQLLEVPSVEAAQIWVRALVLAARSYLKESCSQ